MNCVDCKEDNTELVTCEVCGKRVCVLCFYDFHDGQNLPFAEWPKLSVESAVEGVKGSQRIT